MGGPRKLLSLWDLAIVHFAASQSMKNFESISTSFNVRLTKTEELGIGRSA